MRQKTIISYTQAEAGLGEVRLLFGNYHLGVIGVPLTPGNLSS